MLALRSPAKINLFLRILRRRPDGYHDLASLFQTIDLCDTIHFELRELDRLTCTDPLIPTDSSNLIFKAAHLFRSKTGKSFGLKVHLEKKIPHQAGLGGGSSNAATTLWALNQLCGYPASNEELMRWSGEIGSDVAFFLSGGTAYCTGRGETVRSLPALPAASLWIVKPAEGLSTPQVYQNLDPSALVDRDPELFLKRFFGDQPEYFNDLEHAAFKVKPWLEQLKKHLLSTDAKASLLCGSGSSFFCMGGQKPIGLPHVTVYSAAFINRDSERWY